MHETIAKLIADGWKEYPNQFKPHSRCFYKRIDTPTRCHCNDDKVGMQIQLSIGRDSGSMELELCGELKDETWLKVQNYALPKTVEEVTALISRLLAVWEAAQ